MKKICTWRDIIIDEDGVSDYCFLRDGYLETCYGCNENVKEVGYDKRIKKDSDLEKP